jgi:hypothetical protein
MGRGADHCPCQPRYSTGWPVLIACSTMPVAPGYATGSGDGLLQPLGVLPVGGIAPHPINGGPQLPRRCALERYYRPAAAPGRPGGHAELVVWAQLTLTNGSSSAWATVAPPKEV